MASPTVEHFASELDMLPQVLLDLLKSAGVAKESSKDEVSDADKKQLRDHLIKTRTSAGVVDAPKRTLVKRNPKLIQLRTQTQFEFDTPEHTAFG